jgi:hypothetical protein
MCLLLLLLWFCNVESLFLHPKWGVVLGNGSVILELHVPPSFLGVAGLEICLCEVVDENCIAREKDSCGAVALRRVARSRNEFNCFEAILDPRKVMARLQAACWLLQAVLRVVKTGQVLSDDALWVRMSSSDELSDSFIHEHRISEEMEGRQGLFEKAVKSLKKTKNEGMILEFGGGVSTSILVDLLEADWRKERPLLWTFDWWKGLPRKWRDGFEAGHFSYGGNMPEAINQLAKRGKVTVVEGRIEETIGNFFEQNAGHADLVIIDTCLGDVAQIVLSYATRWMRNGTMVLFGSFLNFDGWSENGEYSAWISSANRLGLNFTYVAYSSTQMLVRVDFIPQVFPAVQNAERPSVIVTVLFCLFLAFLVGVANQNRQKAQEANLKSRLKLFRKRFAVVKQMWGSVFDEPNLKVRNSLCTECKQMLSIVTQLGRSLLKWSLSGSDRDEITVKLQDLDRVQAELDDLLNVMQMKSIAEASYMDALEKVAVAQARLRDCSVSPIR